jgi:hypothetical protein
LVSGSRASKRRACTVVATSSPAEEQFHLERVIESPSDVQILEAIAV